MTIQDRGGTAETVRRGRDLLYEVLQDVIFERLLEVASGEPTKSEAQGFGDDEFVPWVPGAQM
ncbi:MAG: hypothetical protein ACSLE2_07880 [Lysobacterales bacterium]